MELMESYSLALEFRAAQEAVKGEMPVRVWATRLVLFCDVMSALLVIQLGQFSHPAVSVLPILISAIVALQRRDYSDSRTELRAMDPRGILASVLTPKNFSSFGLCRKQTPSTMTVAVMTANRLMCGVLLLVVILQGGDCVAELESGQEYACDCQTLSPNGIPGEWQRLGPDEWSCPTEAKLQILDKYGHFSWNRTVLRGNAAGALCRFGTANYGKTYSGGDSGSDWVTPDFDCSLGGVTAPMLNESCEAEELDIVKFQICRESVPQFFLGVCDGAHTVCAVLDGDMRPRKVALLIYIFLPLCCLLGLILVHLVAFLAQSSLTRIQENKTLRKQVKKQSQIYQEQLQNGNLEHSILFGRVALSLQLAILLLDVVMDVVCFVSFVQTSAWAFAAVQLVIFMASGFMQMRRTNCQSFRRIIVESFKVGLPCNTLQCMFLEEKTFEAPLSLFVQFFSAFYVANDERSFLSLFGSMALSCWGISTGLFISNHLAIVDLEDEDDLKEAEIGTMGPLPSPHVLGHSIQTPHQQHAPFGRNVYPPPPGLYPKPPGVYPPGLYPKRKGQFASDTE